MPAISSITAALSAQQENGVPQPRLVHAAREFEAQMMSELLQPLTASDVLTGDAEGSEGNWGSNGALGQFASEALGQALSQHGGFGVASKIVQDLSHFGTADHHGKVTGNPHNNTQMSIPQSLK